MRSASSELDLDYAAIGIDLRAPQVSDDVAAEDPAFSERESKLWLDHGILPWRPSPEAPQLSVEELLGRAVLRLRLYWGWSQKDLERMSGVDQTTISRFERGLQRGLSLPRIAAILDALRVGEVAFLPRRPIAPHTSLELALYGDPWERAKAAADERLERARRSDRVVSRLNRRRSA